MKRPRKSKRQLAPRTLPPQCLCCGTDNPWVENSVEMTAPFRGRQHTIQAKVSQCRHCDAVSTTPEQAEIISALVREAHRQWISAEFKKAQRELGFTIDSFTAATGIPRATLARASSGGSLIEASLEELLWLKIRTKAEERMKTWMAAIPSGEERIHSDAHLIFVSITTSASEVFSTAHKIISSTSPLDLRRQDAPAGEEQHFEYEALYA